MHENNNELARVSFLQADKLDKLGFDYPTREYYTYDDAGMHFTSCAMPRNHNDRFCWVNKKKLGCSAPTVALALQWVRNKHYLAADVFPTASGWAWCISKAPNDDQPGGTTIKELAWDGPNDGGNFDTYEEAESAVLSEILTIIEGLK